MGAAQSLHIGAPHLNSSLFPPVLCLWSFFFFFTIKAKCFLSRLCMIINENLFNHFHTILGLKRILDHLNSNTSLHKDRKHRSEIFFKVDDVAVWFVSPEKDMFYFQLPGPVNVSIWKRGLRKCDQAKMWSYWMRVGSNPMTGVLISKRKFGHTDPERTSWKDPEHTETWGRMLCGDGGQGSERCSSSQGKPRITSKQQKLGRDKEGLPCRCQKVGPAQTLILDFQPPKP